MPRAEEAVSDRLTNIAQDAFLYGCQTVRHRDMKRLQYCGMGLAEHSMHINARGDRTTFSPRPLFGKYTCSYFPRIKLKPSTDTKHEMKIHLNLGLNFSRTLPPRKARPSTSKVPLQPPNRRRDIQCYAYEAWWHCGPGTTKVATKAIVDTMAVPGTIYNY